MSEVTVITDAARTVTGHVRDGRVFVRREELFTALGWELKPEGLCRGDVCVPVRDRAVLAPDGESDVDVMRVAAALRRPAVADADAGGVVAVALDAEERARMIETDHAPPFVLPDLEGHPHALAEWHGQKRLLVAFATW